MDKKEVQNVPEVMNVDAINGLAVSTKTAIIEAFKPFADQFAEWEEKATSIVVTDVSQTELMKAAREARLALVKVRTGADKVRKELKEESNRYNKAVQEIYNKIEDRISTIEQHLEKQEKFKELVEAKEREAKIAARMDRVKEFPAVTSEMVINLTDEMFETFVKGLESQKAQEEEEERKRIAAEEQKRAIEALHVERKTNLMAEGLWQFMSEESKETHFGELSEEDYGTFKGVLVKLKTDHEAEQERIKQEAEKLKKEAEERAATIAKRNNELRPYIVFIRDYNGLLSKNEEDYQKEFADIKKGAEDHWEYERKEEAKREAEHREQERIAAEKAEQERKEREAAEAERKRLADELAQKEKKEAERKAEAERLEKERIAAEKKAAKAPDKEKLLKWVGELECALPEMKEESTKAIALEIQTKYEGFKQWALKQIESI